MKDQAADYKVPVNNHQPIIIIITMAQAILIIIIKEFRMKEEL